jgi:Beta-propeller repeat/Abnormal spindle-like microcephaly-assoc'd, ASPM-SPD-2-Hydin
MNRAYVVCLFLLLTTTFLLPQSNPVPLINPSARVAPPGVVSSIGVSQADPKAQAKVLDSYGKLPLRFEANHGQSDGQVKFLSRTGAYTLFLTGDEAVLALRGTAKKPAPKGASRFGGATVSLKRYPDTNPSPATPQSMTGGVLRMRLRDANPAAKVTGLDELAGTSNYFIGNDPTKWRTNVPTYAKVKYEGIYSGIDLVYYGNQRGLEYDFVLQPGANPGAIRLGIDGASKLRFDRGDLVVSSPGGDVRLRRPYSYQAVNGTKREVSSHYIMNKKHEVGFRIASYDRSRPLIIDPLLAYSTYLGGSTDDYALAIAVDSGGNAYVTGGTTSTDFPTANAFQSAYSGGSSNAFVTKINADGSALVYSTYLGGSSDFNFGQSIAVDSAGSVYLTGATGAHDFPTVNPIQPTNHGIRDAFVTKISPDGSALVYSTYLGGSGDDYGWGIAVDSAGNAHVTGDTPSRDFPVLKALQPTFHEGANFNSFVSEINADGSALIYSTYWGGSGGEGGSRVAVDPAGNTYVGGYTFSPDFPTVNAIQPTYAGNVDAYLTKLSADGQKVFYSTFLGGSGFEYGWDVAVDSSGNAYMTGFTQSTNFPTAHALQPTNHGGTDAFVAKINASGNAFVYSTYLGGSNTDLGAAIAADSGGNAYVGGYTKSNDFPTVDAIQPTNHGGFDSFVAKISGDGSALLYSTYLGGKANESIFDAGYRDVGIAVDSEDSAYVTGTTKSINFPKTLLAFQQSLKGGADAFVAKIASKTFVSVSPQKLTYATQVIGTTSVGKKLTLANTGSSTLTINKIYVAGVNAVDFAETNNCPAMLAAGGSCTIEVTFTPTEKDKRKGVLAISDSDPTRLQAVALIGTGTVVNLSPKTLRFGKQLVGTASAPKTVTLTNTGSATLNFTGISIAGSDAGDFAQINTCGTGIGGGASCTITVTFKPTATGTRTAAVRISDDGGGSPQMVSLNGTGT